MGYRDLLPLANLKDGSEADVLCFALDRARFQFAWKTGGLDVRVEGDSPNWIMNRRRMLVDLLEEYMKHTGHADLFREAVDGRVGNDPPWDEVPDA
jgi:hypothetical protein